MWRKYVKYMMRDNPGVPLKKLLKNYDKKRYEEFKKNPKKLALLGVLFVLRTPSTELIWADLYTPTLRR